MPHACRSGGGERRRDVAALLGLANEIAVPHADAAGRALSLERLGFSTFDALHLAVAEQEEVDVFLTSDDVLVRRARRYISLLRTRVENPLSWYEELVL